MSQANPFPTFVEDMMVELDEQAWMVHSTDLLSFWHASHSCTSFFASIFMEDQ
jgi:hypothetical protein